MDAFEIHDTFHIITNSIYSKDSLMCAIIGTILWLAFQFLFAFDKTGYHMWNKKG